VADCFVKSLTKPLAKNRVFPVTVDQLDMLKLGNVCPESKWTETFSITPKRFEAESLKYLSKPEFGS